MRTLTAILTLALLAACAPAAAPPAAPPPTATAESPRPPATRPPATLVASPAALPTTPAEPLDDPEALASVTPLVRDQRALAVSFSGQPDIPQVARTTPLDVRVGDVEQFWVADLAANTMVSVTAELRYAGPAVLMYVETSLSLPQAELEAAARSFEGQIYPRMHQLFGREPLPGVDGDPRLTVLHTPLAGALGYFSSTDSFVRAVNRFSNEREMFLIDPAAIPPGSPGYLQTLTHEFQHMIHWGRQVRSPTWFTEGMSVLAEDLNGYGSDDLARRYLATPDTQLTAWAAGDASIAHYGAAHLFLRYFFEHYGAGVTPGDLIAADAGNDLPQLVRLAAARRPDITSFAELYADWATANIVDDPSVGDGRFAYPGLPAPPATTPVSASSASTVAQFGADYLVLPEGPLTLRLDGSDTVSLVGADPAAGRFAWWAIRGDESVAQLTRPVDLRGVSRATLSFRLWHELEASYDYGFVAVSTDGGTSWQTLPGQTTRTDDPQGHNFGHGFTGSSVTPGAAPSETRATWIDETVDLTPFAGREVLLRFMVVTDAALNEPGLLLDEIRIPEIGFADGAEQGDSGWQAEGFVRSTGQLPQRWIVRLIRVAGERVVVEELPTDAAGDTELQLSAGERGVLLLAGATPATTERASYRYTIARP